MTKAMTAMLVHITKDTGLPSFVCEVAALVYAISMAI